MEHLDFALAVDSAAGDQAPPVVLCVDDEPNVLSALRRVFRGERFQVAVASSGAQALAVLETSAVDVVISDMRMPGMSGADLLEHVRNRWPNVTRMLLTGYADVGSTIAAVNRGEIYRYIAKPWSDDEVRSTVRQALERLSLERERRRLEALVHTRNMELEQLNAVLESRVEQRTAELRAANESLSEANDRLARGFVTSLKIFSSLIELRAGHLAGHGRRVADLARQIAYQMCLSDEEVQDVFLAALLHDIGKIGLPDDVLSTPSTQLRGKALLRYRAHPVLGEQALMALPELRGAAKILRSHHERFDGTGFPDALVGLEVPIGSRILAVANDFDGLIEGTLIARRLDRDEALAAILRGRGSRYDPQVVDALAALLGARSGLNRDLALRACDLRAGMKLSRDLVSAEGIMLLTAEQTLDERLIRQLLAVEASAGKLLTVHVHD